MKGIIYKATNTLNGKVYIGQTLNSIDSRRRDHLHNAAAGSNTPFHKALRVFGKENFVWEAVKEVQTSNDILPLAMKEMRKAETEQIILHDSNNPQKGYNAATQIDAAGNKTTTRKPWAVYSTSGELLGKEFNSYEECRRRFGKEILPAKITKRGRNNIAVFSTTKYIATQYDRVKSAPKHVTLILTAKHSHSVKKRYNPVCITIRIRKEIQSK